MQLRLVSIQLHHVTALHCVMKKLIFQLIWNNIFIWIVVVPMIWALVLSTAAISSLVQMKKSFRKVFHIGAKELVAVSKNGKFILVAAVLRHVRLKPSGVRTTESVIICLHFCFFILY